MTQKIKAFRLSEELIEELRVYAFTHKTTYTEIIQEALRNYLDKQPTDSQSKT